MINYIEEAKRRIEEAVRTNQISGKENPALIADVAVDAIIPWFTQRIIPEHETDVVVPFGYQLKKILSDRQLEVLQLFAEGKSSKEVAKVLGCERNTIQSHARRILEKLGAANRAHAVAIGLRGGIIH